MVLTKEDLQEISGLLAPINDRLDKMDERFTETDGRFDKIDEKLSLVVFRQNHMAQKIEDLRLDMKVAYRDIRRDIHDLNDQMETVIEVLRLNEMLPR